MVSHQICVYTLELSDSKFFLRFESHVMFIYSPQTHPGTFLGQSNSEKYGRQTNTTDAETFWLQAKDRMAKAQSSSVHLVSWLTTNAAFELPILVVYTDDCRRDIDSLQADGCILNFSTSIGSHGYTHTHMKRGR